MRLGPIPRRGSAKGAGALDAHSTEREIRRRRGLPGSRAVVGGLLMAVAAVGVFAAYTDATDAPSTTFVVAAGPLRPGERIEADDLRQVRGTLPAAIGDRTFLDPEQLVGRAALTSVGEGDLLQASMVSDDATVGHEVALALPRAQVAVGRLKPGERVDVFVTGDDRTDVVARGAAVVEIDAGDDGSLTSERTLTLVLAVSDGDVVAALVHALRTGDVTVVRSTFSEVPADEPLTFDAGDPGADEAA
jgi:Flp pilus assembly protein CpaB